MVQLNKLHLRTSHWNFCGAHWSRLWLFLGSIRQLLHVSSVYLLWFELLLLVCLLALSEVVDFTVPLWCVCICVCVSSGCRAEHQDTAHCGSSNGACGECYNPGYHGALALHTHTHTLLKLSDPKHYTHPVLISLPHTQIVTHIKSTVMLLFDSSLWFGTSQEVLHGGGKWLDNKERLGLGG